MADLGAGPIAVDTPVFIYFIEAHPKFQPLITPLFQAADKRDRQLVTSALTLLEVLVLPYRLRNLQLAAEYEAILTRAQGLTVVRIDHEQLRTAAEIRATTRIKTPDALQLAAALKNGCKSFLTNDRKLPSLPGLSIVDLGKYA